MVGLEPVPGHLVEEDAAEAAADDHRHRARGRRTGVEQGQRLPRCLLGDQAGIVFEQLEAAVGAERLRPGLDRVATAGDRLGADAGASAVVAAQQALGVGDGDLAAGLGVGGGELGYLGAAAARSLVELAQQRRLALGGNVFGPALDRQRRARHGAQRPRLPALAAQRRRGLVGGALEVGGVEPVDVGEVGGAVGDDPHTGALLGAGLDGLDPRLVDRHREPAPPFDEDLGEVPAVGQRPGEDALGDRGFDQLAHPFDRFPATSISRPAATNSSAPATESSAWSLLRPLG